MQRLRRLTSILPILICLLGLSASPASAAPASATDWLGQVTNQVDDLITTHGDALVDIGTTELNFVALIALVGMVVRWNLAHIVIGYRPVNFTIGDLVLFFLQLAVCAALLHYYYTPIARGISVHNLFAYAAQAVASTLDNDLINDFLARIRAVLTNLQHPSFADIGGIVLYYFVSIDVALMDLAMFAVDAFGWVAYAMFSLFGPLFIPLYLTRNFQSKFWHWLDGLIVFSFYRAVSAGFTFIWVNILIGFFDNTVKGQYDLGHWLALLGTLLPLTGAFLYAIFQIPRITSMLFGGVGDAAQLFNNSVIGLVQRAVLR